MFSGIIRDVGTVLELRQQADDVSLYIQTHQLPPERLLQGASIALNGVCLTVTEVDGRCCRFDVSQETLRCTTLGNLQVQARVNLEPALTTQQALDGHLVSGHVDGVGRILRRQAEARSECFQIQASVGLLKYIAIKGSICVDGVSLTVNAVSNDGFSVNIIPYTLQETTLGAYLPGQRVNLEVDILARYLERLLQARGISAASI